MKKLEHEVLRVEHFFTIGGKQNTDVLIRLNECVEEKYLQIEVNELDVEKTPREKIEAEIKRLSIDTSDFSYASSLSIKSKIEALELALTYL